MAAFLETILLGVYLSLFRRTMRCLSSEGSGYRSLLHRPLFWTAIVMCAAILGNWVTAIACLWRVFVLRPDTAYFSGAGLDMDFVQYLSLSDPIYVANWSFYVAGTFIGDAFMAYRLFVVWSKSWAIVIPPIAMCTSLIVTGSMVTWLFSRITHGNVSLNVDAWVTASLALTLVCNIYSTGLISLNVHLSKRRLAKLDNGRMGSIKIRQIGVFIQSAALYSLLLILSLGTYLAGSNLVFITVAATSPTIGIIFCMIVSRTHKVARIPFYLQTSPKASAIPGAATNSPRRTGRDEEKQAHHADPCPPVQEAAANDIDMICAADRSMNDLDNRISETPSDGRLMELQDDEIMKRNTAQISIDTV